MGFLSGIFGSKPKAPKAPELDSVKLEQYKEIFDQYLNPYLANIGINIAAPEFQAKTEEQKNQELINAYNQLYLQTNGLFSQNNSELTDEEKSQLLNQYKDKLGYLPNEAAIIENTKGILPAQAYLDKLKLQQDKNVKAVNDIGSPDLLTTYIQDSVGEDIVNKILEDQFGNAKIYLENAKTRGQLNDVGFTEALSKAQQQKLAGKSQLDSFSNSIIQQGRDELANIISQAEAKARVASLALPTPVTDPEIARSDRNQLIQKYGYTGDFGVDKNNNGRGDALDYIANLSIDKQAALNNEIKAREDKRQLGFTGPFGDGRANRFGENPYTNNFDIGKYQQQISDFTDKFKKDFEGKLLAVTGDQQFIDPAKALQFGGTKQGVVSNDYSQLEQAYNKNKNLKTQQTGLGTRGSF